MECQRASKKPILIPSMLNAEIRLKSEHKKSSLDIWSTCNEKNKYFLEMYSTLSKFQILKSSILIALKTKLD